MDLLITYLVCSVEDSEKFVPIAAFECRGVSPIAFEMRDGWECEGVESGTPFEPDLSDDWSDFDDKSQEAVSILSIETKFERS